MTKHESACIAYVRANAEIRRLTRLIGIQISNCCEAKAKKAGEDPEYDLPNSCLTDYFTDVNMARNDGYFAEYPDTPDCDFCGESLRLIQERKKARQTLGAAKRQITVLGKAAMKESAS